MHEKMPSPRRQIVLSQGLINLQTYVHTHIHTNKLYFLYVSYLLCNQETHTLHIKSEL